MNTFTKVLLIVLVVMIAALAVLYFLGKKLQARQAAQQAQIDAAKQSVSMLIIDKKKMKIKESGLPAAVIAQVPKYMHFAKFPIVKAKIGPQIMSLICDEAIFDSVPTKKEVKATVSGIYITDVKGIRGHKIEKPTKKQNKFKAWVSKMQEKAGAKPLK